MSANLKALKDALDLRTLIVETHTIDRHGKVRCPNPAHEDHNPSCHIRSHRFKCFSCGFSGDHIDWLELVYDINTAEAIQELKRRVRVSGYFQHFSTPFLSPLQHHLNRWQPICLWLTDVGQASLSAYLEQWRGEASN